MIKRQTYKFPLKPTGRQERILLRWVGQCRFIYNLAFFTAQAEYKADNTAKFSGARLSAMLPKWKKEFPWLTQAPAASLQQALKNLEAAYHRFFKGISGFPKKHRKGQKESIRFPAAPVVEQNNNRIKLPKHKIFGWLKYVNCRPIIGKIKQATISRRAGKWFISILAETEIEPLPVKDVAIGIDMGITHFAAGSDGAFFDRPFRLEKQQKALKKAQQKMSRKKRLSKNWLKALARVRKLHERGANIRKDFQHKLSTKLADIYGKIFCEKLKIQNMSKSAKGTAEEPGKNVKAKSGLNRSILEQGWGAFLSMLEYKLEWRGGELVKVNPPYTSQTCPQCGHIAKENRETQAAFKCVSCRFSENADKVGAINIFRAGLARCVSQVNGVGHQQEKAAEAVLAFS